jgi:3-oxoacyl-[acyl-carrier-protein] synthase II
VTRVSRFPTDDYPSRIAAQLGPIPVPAGCDPRELASRTPLDRLAHWCGETALRDAGLWGAHRELRVGLVLGLGAEWMFLWETDDLAGGGRLHDPDQDRDATIERARRALGLSGPSLGLSAACASGNHALEVARHWLRLGLVDLCVAGACDLAVTPIGLATFGNLRALSRRNDDPAAASRPFDRGRDGFVLGEGGVAFVLERSGDARRRSAAAYAEVAGCGSSSDAHHHVIPSPDPA